MPTNNKAKDLKDSLRFTYLDVENAGFRSGSVTGFGFNNKDLKTQYPSTTTGKPTPTQYPAGPAKRFVSNFGPRNVYLDQVDIIKQNGPLLQSLESSKLDDDKNPNLDPTIYPLTSKGISSAGGHFPIEGKPSKIFGQKYSFDNTYYDSISQV